MWWGVGLYAVCLMPQRPYLLAGALVNTLMFLVISIPMADKRQSAKEGFAEYKKETRILLPVKKSVRGKAFECRTSYFPESQKSL